MTFPTPHAPAAAIVFIPSMTYFACNGLRHALIWQVTMINLANLHTTQKTTMNPQQSLNHAASHKKFKYTSFIPTTLEAIIRFH